MPEQNQRSSEPSNQLGQYLKDRRAKLDPAEYGITALRRRTPGLRREEVAQRANVSATWYTWLEQGRGGAPSADVLDRIAGALSLTVAEREHLFLLAQHRMPEVQFHTFEPVSQQLQRVIDSLEYNPTIVKTAMWDVVAWNKAASAMFADYAAMPPEERNSMRILFCNKRVRQSMVNWETDVRAAVASFRSDIARVGDSARVNAFIEHMSATSEEFRAIWDDYAVRNHGEGVKLVRHDAVGQITFEYSTFSVDDRPDLGMVIYTPATAEDRARVRSVVEAKNKASAEAQ